MNRRDQSLDILRAIAVMLMVTAHCIYFLNTNSNPIFKILAAIGNISAFIIFLFVSGAATYLSFLSGSDRLTAVHRKHIFLRGVTIYFGYLTLAIPSALLSDNSHAIPEILNSVIAVLSFKSIPSFSEFILPFILFSLSVIFLEDFYRKISRHFSLGLVISLFLVSIGYLFYPIVVPQSLITIKSLFTGTEGMLSYPILEYFIVFYLGMRWGYVLKHHEEKTATIEGINVGMLVSMIATAVLLLSTIIPAPILDPLNRWPPSIGFLTLGIAFCFCFLIISRLIRISRHFSWLGKILVYLGRDSFDICVVHILVLFAISRWSGSKTDNPFNLFLLSMLVLSVSVIISSLNWKTSPSLFTIGPIALSGHGKYRIKRKYILAIILFIILAASGIVTSPIPPTGGIIRSNTYFFSSNSATTQNDNPWFSQAYGFRRKIYIPAMTTNPVNVKLTIHHADLVKNRKSNQSGSDLMIIHTTNGASLIVPISVNNTATETTEISSFLKQWNKNTDTLYLYYGNDMAEELRSAIPSETDNNVAEGVIGEEESSPYHLTIDKRWFLKDCALCNSDPILITFQGHIPENQTAVVRLMQKEPIYFPLIQRQNGVYSSSIIPSELETGEYLVSIVSSVDKTQLSRIVKITVSAPLYVSWSFDWEGWDVSDTVLDDLDLVSKEYGSIPFTHFFNPRIYLPNVIPASRSATLTDFVLYRKNTYGDEIGLHIHMLNDMVEASGVSPKSQPRWGYKGGIDGYDVPITAYSFQEISKMLEWSKTEFSSHGLPQPIGFRAGGWYADTVTLQALSDSGFLYDSSGRDEIIWHGAAKSPWKLNAITQPYYPSRINQNSAGIPAHDILEIPNNGGDTNEYSPDEMLSRLKHIDSTKILPQKKSAVFMTHPQWWETEKPGIEAVLTALRPRFYSTDSGPVVFVTVQAIHSVWK